MKPKTILWKILSAGILLSLIFLVVMSCKKKDDDAPVPTPPPVTQDPKSFKDQSITILSDYEKQNKKGFSTAMYYRHFSHVKSHATGQKGGVVSSIFSALGSVYNFFKHKQELAELKTYLDGFNTKLNDISNEIQALSLQLQLDETKITNTINSVNEIDQISKIQTAYGTDYLGLRYYTNQGSLYGQGLADSASTAGNINPFINTFVNSVYTSTDMEDALNTLAGMMNGTPVLGFDGSLKTFAKLIIEEMGSSSDSSAIRKGYELIENYFSYVITYELQACIVKTNVLNYKVYPSDTAGIKFISEYFSPLMESQVNEFLNVVDYYVASIYDYRTLEHSGADFPYAGSGLAPDQASVNVLARARFLANTLLDALGMPYPSYCGEIILPNYYSQGTSVVPAFTLTMAGVTLNKQQDTLIASQIPYTYWTSGGETGSMVYQYDNHWKVIRYAQVRDATHSFMSVPQTILLPDNGNQNFPWSHFSTINGSCTPRWYNPGNPEESSSVQTDSCSMQFSFFSSTWRWGYLNLYLGDRGNVHLSIPQWKNIPIYGYVDSQDEGVCNYGLNLSEWHSQEVKVDDFTSTYSDGIISNTNHFSGGYQHGLPSTGNTWVVMDMAGCSAQKASGAGGLPEQTVFCSYSFQNQNAGSASNCGLYIGTDLQEGGLCQKTSKSEYYSNCNLAKIQQGANATGTWSGNSSATVSSGTSSPHYQWYWTWHQPPNCEVTVSFDIRMQYVFMGLLNNPLP